MTSIISESNLSDSLRDVMKYSMFPLSIPWSGSMPSLLSFLPALLILSESVVPGRKYLLSLSTMSALAALKVSEENFSSPCLRPGR